MDTRPSGIDVIGSVSWGTHFCHFYETPQDLSDVLTPYFKAGLERNEYCMWVTSAPLTSDDALRALRAVVPGADRYVDSGQLEILPHTDWYLKGGTFDLKRVMDEWVGKLDGALRRGFDGARVTGNTAWLDGDTAWQSFAEYEQTLDGAVGNLPLIVLCSYALSKCGASEILDVIRNHEFALIKRAGQWEVIESLARKQMKEALRDSQANLRSFYDSAPFLMGLVELTEEDVLYVSANAATAAFFGKSAAELAAEPLASQQGLPRATVELWRRHYGEAARLGRPVQFQHPHPMGEAIRWLSATVAPVQPAPGRPRRFSYVVADVTEAKQAQDQIQQLNHDLAQRAAALEAANQELAAFDYSVSHDLRAPLRGIATLSRALLQDYLPALPADGQRSLQLIQERVTRMAELLDGLLALSRLGREAVRKQPMQPGDLAREAFEELLTEHPGHHVECTIGDLPACEADPVLLKQVFTNLLSNALKFTRDRDTARIEVGCREEAGEPVYFVADNGVGFDLQKASKLFDAFHRLHRPQEYAGTGVGLAIVQRIVTRHGGRVWADAVPGAGAIFSFTLGPGGA
jgi:signal transduction histidine kinase